MGNGGRELKLLFHDRWRHAGRMQFAMKREGGGKMIMKGGERCCCCKAGEEEGVYMHEPALHVRGGGILVDLGLKLNREEDSRHSGDFRLYVDLPCSKGEDTTVVKRYGAELRRESGRQDLLDQNTQLMLPSLRKTGSARMPTDVFNCLQGERVSLTAKCSLDPTKVDRDLVVQGRLDKKKASGSTMVASLMKKNLVEVRKHQRASGLPLEILPIQGFQYHNSEKLGRIQTGKRACRFSDTQVDNRSIQIPSSSKRRKWTEVATGGSTKHDCDQSAPTIKNLQSFPKQILLDRKVRGVSKESTGGYSQILGSRNAVTELKHRVKEGGTPKLEVAAEVVSSECCRGNSLVKRMCEPRKISSLLSGNSAATIDEDISREEEAAEFEQCVSLLTKYGVLKGRDYYRSRNLPSNVSHPGFVGDGLLSKPCKICGVLEDGKGTVICDECQDAFHISCCIPRVTLKYFEKEDDWYCNTCRKLKKKTASKFSSETLLSKGVAGFNSNVSENGFFDRFGKPTVAGSHYVSKVRLGPAHQVDVPSWTGRVEEKLDAGCPGTETPLCEEEKLAEEERIRKEHEDNIQSLGWLRAELLPQGCSENWLQCHCIVEKGLKDPDGRKHTDGIICGKWRRAPLGVEQKENWECFCTILWDPFHADCAVPQELTTDEVMKRMQWRSINVCNDEAMNVDYMRET